MSPTKVPVTVPAFRSSKAEPCFNSILLSVALYWNVMSSPEPPSSVMPVASTTSLVAFPLPRTMFLSSTVIVAVFSVVVVPETVKSDTVNVESNVMLPSSFTVRVLTALFAPVTSILGFAD